MPSIPFPTWPATWLAIASGALLLLALGQVVSALRRWRARRPVAALCHIGWLLVLLALGSLVAGTALSLRGWQRLATETPILDLTAHHAGPQRWIVVLQFPDGHRQRVMVDGDAWRVEAIVVKWRLPAIFAGVPPLYRLDRLSGRYADPRVAATAPPTVVPLEAPGSWDIALLSQRYTRWLPFVDTVYGSGVYLPLIDGASYQVSLMATGALVARQTGSGSLSDGS